MKSQQQAVASKVPEVTVLFWVLKIFATTLGETAGDAFSMSLGLGYLLSTGIFGLLVAAAVAVQIRARAFHPVTYWVTIMATTTVGTTLADFADRSLGIGYAGGSVLLLALLLATLVTWHRVTGTLAVESVSSPRTEVFYWTAIICSQTLGTALGDWTADDAKLGYLGGTVLFGGLLLMIALAWWKSSLPRPILFWAAFILTRPLGAVVGDLLDKPLDQGGLAMGRFTASGILLAMMAAGLLFFPQKPASKHH